MSIPITRKSIDHSSADHFGFSFFCDRCGKEWKSQTLPFNYGNFSIIENEEARQLIWAQEHKAAFEHANLEAHMRFSLCPICGKWVCDDCIILEDRHKETCKECSLVCVV